MIYIFIEKHEMSFITGLTSITYKIVSTLRMPIIRNIKDDASHPCGCKVLWYHVGRKHRTNVNL